MRVHEPDSLGILNSVMGTNAGTVTFCLNCGKAIEQVPKKRPKQFCSDKCRCYMWQRQRKFLTEVDPTSEDAHVCEWCGKTFYAYSQKKRKYCSRDCYNSARTKNNNSLSRETQDVGTPTQIEEAQDARTPTLIEDAQDVGTPTQIEDAQDVGTPTQIEEAQDVGTPTQIEEAQPLEPEDPIKPARKQISQADIEQYKTNPYIRSATLSTIEPDITFFMAARPLLDLGMDSILAAFEMKPENFSSREKKMFFAMMDRLDSSTSTDLLPEVINDTQLRIMFNRTCLMEQLIESRLRDIGARIKDMSTGERKEICLTIRDMPKDPSGIITVDKMLELCGICRNSYYRYIRIEKYGLCTEARDAVDEPYVRLAFEYKNYKKGYRMVYMLIPILTGRKIGIDRVRRIMRKYGMHCDVRKAKTNRQEEEDKRKKYHKPNLLRRMFRLHRPNEVRITDVTHLKYGDKQKAYGSALMDPVTGVLVAFVVSDHNDLELAKETLRRADSHPCKDGGIFHSDQGSVYLSPQFQKEVEEMGFDQSMSKRGNCWDNAPQESFFGHFKDECDYSGCSNLDELRAVIDDYSYYYNNERGLWDRKHMTPLQYEAYLLSLNDDEFAKYMALEEQKYAEMKTNAAEKAKERYKTLGV